jgi:hypothetical protein
MRESRLTLTPMLLAAMLLLLDFSIAASALPSVGNVDSYGIDEVEPASIERDPAWPEALVCGQSECDSIDRSVRFPPFDASWPVEDAAWWFTYWYDLDFNGMDDRLQRIIS